MRPGVVLITLGALNWPGLGVSPVSLHPSATRSGRRASPPQPSTSSTANCPWLSVRVWREGAEMPSPARMLAPGRKIHHGAWGGHFAFSGLAASSVFWARFLYCLRRCLLCSRGLARYLTCAAWPIFDSTLVRRRTMRPETSSRELLWRTAAINFQSPRIRGSLSRRLRRAFVNSPYR